MTFNNEQVPPDVLPDWRDVELAPVSARYVPYRVLSVVGRWLFAGLLVWIFSRIADGPLLQAAPALVLVLTVLGTASTLLAAWEARRRGWALREHDLIYQSGLLVRRTTVLPFRRVQHVEALNGPLERVFGLLRLTCYTAGGLSADLVVAGLDVATAQRVRQFLLGRIHELEEADPRPHSADAGHEQHAG